MIRHFLMSYSFKLTRRSIIRMLVYKIAKYIEIKKKLYQGPTSTVFILIN